MPPGFTAGSTDSRPKRKHRTSAETVRVYVLRVVLLVVIIAVWQYIGSRSTHNQFFYSKPSDIWSSLGRLLTSSDFYVDLRYTMYETVVGFLIGGAAGIILGFGLGVQSKIALVISLVFFPLFLNAYKGATTIDPDQVLLMHTFRARRRDVVRKITLPATAPWVITGAKLGVAQALGGAVIGEIIAAQFGLGAALNTDAQSFATGDEFAIILVLIVIALLLNGIFTIFESRTSSWR
jgi:NitT/TauT family transport system permease protein